MNKVINGYVLVYEPKVLRAYDKELGAGPNATDEQVLAFYDKFGGLVLKDGVAVETGSLWRAYNEKKSKKSEEKVEVTEEVVAKKAAKAAKKAK